MPGEFILIICCVVLLTFLFFFIKRFFAHRLANNQTQAPPEIKTPSFSEIVLVLVAIVLSLIIRLKSMTRGLVYDEIHIALYYVDKGSVWNILTSNVGIANHAAQSLLSLLSIKIFGHSEWALRLPSLILGLLSLPAIWCFIRRYQGATAAVLTLFILSV